MPSTDDYIRDHPGDPCSHCGTSNDRCLRSILKRGSARGPCCGECQATETHRVDEIAEEKRVTTARTSYFSGVTLTYREFRARLVENVGAPGHHYYVISRSLRPETGEWEFRRGGELTCPPDAAVAQVRTILIREARP